MADRLFPVILSGGMGTRLWPASRASYPKQLLPLCSRQSMLVDTAQRITGEQDPIIVCSAIHRFIIAEQLQQAGIRPHAILLEPIGRNTAAAVAIAAFAAIAVDPDALLLVMPSDHVIADLPAFQAAVTAARPAAAKGHLVTFGVDPIRPETGYGYIKRAGALKGFAGVLAVERFAEKPDLATAERYLREGGYFWNAGIFLMSARTALAELERHAPDVLKASRAAWQAGVRDLDFYRLDEAAFSACPSISIDVAVMEKTDRAAMVPVSMGWNDLGAWDALWELGEKDSGDNVLIGDVIAHNLRGSYVKSDDHRLTAVVGLENVVVVTTDDAILVADRSQAQDVKHVVERLLRDGRKEPSDHSTVYRPWGSYRTVDAGSRFLVKQIVVNPGASLSLQYHHHRAEHWIVVEGTARVTCGDKSFLLTENQSTYIPIGEVHRLENPGTTPLRLIEVQSGDYLGEDDIVRVEDRYGRSVVPAAAKEDVS